jgi:protein-tyrosine phosphatase
VIDLHCHLHFDIDDGPVDAEATFEMMHALEAAGVTDIACTPHIRSDKGWMNTRSQQEGQLERLRDMLKDRGLGISLHAGAEHYLDGTLMTEVPKEEWVPYGDSQYILLELPYHGPPPRLLELLHQVALMKFRIVLAHLERFPYVADDRDLVERMLDSGYLIQVNLGSLAGAYTRPHKKAAQSLVKNGYAALACSDCHCSYDVERFLLKGKKALRKIVGDEGVHRLTVENPKKILENLPPHKIWP